MYEKYTTSLKLVSLVSETNSVDKEQRRAAALKAWDNLFEFMLANFQPPVSVDWSKSRTEEAEKEFALCRKVLQEMDASDIYHALGDIPPSIPETVWPVAAARYLLRDCGIQLNLAKSKTFMKFVDVYGNMILSVPFPRV